MPRTDHRAGRRTVWVGRGLRVLVGLVVLVAGVLPGSASAATMVANGQYPDAVVDRDGVTHLVWNEERTGDQADQLHYCRIPPGASACDSVRSFAPSADQPSGNHDLV